MIAQVYGILDPDEALAVIAAGADYIGICPPQYAGYDDTLTEVVSEETTFAILQATKGLCKRVLIALSDDPQVTYNMVERHHPDVIHISAPNFAATPEVVAHIRALDPAIKILQAIAVGSAKDIETARHYAGFVDMLILDSANPDDGMIGAAGVGHDRALDRAIVEAVDIPVIVAGGLGPDNVAQVIAETHPWGVDSLTGTNKIFPDGSFVKDIELVRAFCQNAKAAGQKL